MAVLLILVDRTSFDVWGAVLIAPALVAASVPALRRQAAREADPALFRLLLFALVVKLAGCGRSGTTWRSPSTAAHADATRYHNAGVQLAGPFRHLDFSAFHFVTGTSFIENVTGVVYAIIGPSKMGGFVFFSWLGFWGLFLFYRAFVIGGAGGTASLVRAHPVLHAVPALLAVEHRQGGVDDVRPRPRGVRGREDPRPADAWRGLVPLGAGLWLAGMVRPHIAALIGVSLAAAVITRKTKTELRELTPVLKGGTIVAVAILAAVLVVRTDRFLQGSGIDTSGGVSSTLTDVQDRTGEGGSEFVPSIVDSPVRAPLAIVTVLFRPFISEAHNAQSLFAAIEGTALLVICLLRWRWLWAAVRSLRRQPYVVFCLIYSGLFIVAYSSFANFGLLARAAGPALPAVPGPDLDPVRRSSASQRRSRRRRSHRGVSAFSGRTRAIVDAVGALLLLLYYRVPSCSPAGTAGARGRSCCCCWRRPPPWWSGGRWATSTGRWCRPRS